VHNNRQSEQKLFCIAHAHTGNPAHMDSQGDRKSGRTRRQKYLLKTVTVSWQPGEATHPSNHPPPTITLSSPARDAFHTLCSNGFHCIRLVACLSLTLAHTHTHTQMHTLKCLCVSAFMARGVAGAEGRCSG